AEAVVRLTLALPPSGPQTSELTTALLAVMTQLQTGRNWTAAAEQARQTQTILRQSEAALLLATPLTAQGRARQSLSQLNITLAVLESALTSQNFTATRTTWQESLWQLCALRLALLADYQPPAPPQLYRTLPRLVGWRLVQVRTVRGDFTILLDGYSAPLGAGSFWQAVQSGAWREKVRLTDQGRVVRWSNPTRPIPLEIRPQTSRNILYNPTTAPEPALAFTPAGTVALALPTNLKQRPDEEQLAPSQLFIHRPPPTAAQARTLDGRFAVVGYVVAGLNDLNQLQDQDRILEVTPLTCTRNNFEEGSLTCLLTGGAL
ncbi:peptidylprolyl isomerase, partial [Candidatus Cyanaurora vandensis]